MKLCHKCGTAWVSEQRYPGRTPGECTSPTTELVVAKEKANFCGEFDFAVDRGSGTEDTAREKGRQAWDTLFGE